MTSGFNIAVIERTKWKVFSIRNMQWNKSNVGEKIGLYTCVPTTCSSMKMTLAPLNEMNEWNNLFKVESLE